MRELKLEGQDRHNVGYEFQTPPGRGHLEDEKFEVTEEAFRRFLDYPPLSLERLTLRRTGLLNRRCKHLADWLPRMTVVSLDLSENSIGIRGVRSLANVLHATSIVELHLDGNKTLTEKACELLIAVAQTKPGLLIRLKDSSLGKLE
ncbi:Aste57867_24857 [Aphanomyces stellatus]|uniref:Aste57867_24857 protein n=1 Tax=Aphanomyces stellatus TaxID=120398 RepID=A0A485LSZ7_9STRA|nr:hypothetical protein As57867_024779 [Aphanomyces stellatus]VFU01491.1 Aste57867_24857 [Aphanomyces stellatus]